MTGKVPAIFLAVMLSVFSGSLVHAQEASGLSASTNRQSYVPGDKVIITGTVQQVTDGNPVTLIIRNPIGNVYEVGQVSLLNNDFVHDFVLSSDAQGGIYTVNMRQGNETGEIQFQVVAGQTQIVRVFDSEIRISGNDSGLIKYGNAAVSPADNSITIQVDTSRLQAGPIMEEYHIPKQVIDTTNGQLLIKENGNDVNCKQTRIDSERIVDCPVFKGTNQITIVGTSVIPEFGMVAPLVLALGIGAVACFASKNRLSGSFR